MLSEASSSHNPNNSPSPASPSSSSSSTLPSTRDAGKMSEGGDSDNPAGSSSRCTPTTTAAATTSPTAVRSHTAGKGGCWTCRIRRKKCDEEREGDSCKTCLRLGIECLGWGPQRPDWMRDKDKVADYKAGIKEQLTRAGLIRGIPRPSPYQPPHRAVVSSQNIFSSVGPSSYSSLRRNRPGMNATYNTTFASNPQTHTSTILPAIPNNTNGQNPAMTSSYLDTPYNSSMFYTSPTLPTLSLLDNSDTIPYDVYGNDLASIPPPLTVPPPTPELAASHEEYIVYYLNRVRPLQFAFAGSAVTTALCSIVYSEPRGAVANAICALASLHSSPPHLGMPQGLGDPTELQRRSTSKYYYDQAVSQLMNKKLLGGQYVEQDAIAAAYLVSFSMLSGGNTDWTSMLDVACDWLAQTGIQEDQNPKLALMDMGGIATFAAKATMWMDVLSSVTFQQTPRFLSLYRRLFASCAGYWASAGETFDCRMDLLTGCPDAAVLALAETAALAHWKASESRNGTLSMRELIRRGEVIEQELKASPLPCASDGASPPSRGERLLSAPAVSTLRPEGSDASAPGDDVRLLVAKIHQENALLYLNTVLNGSHPGVPEIASNTAVIGDLLRRLPVTDYDRAIVFPLFLAGALSDDPMLHNHITRRCADDYVGNLYQARTLLGVVWSRRHQAMGLSGRGAHVEWRECLKDRWPSLLLV